MKRGEHLGTRSEGPRSDRVEPRTDVVRVNQRCAPLAEDLPDARERSERHSAGFHPAKGDLLTFEHRSHRAIGAKRDHARREAVVAAADAQLGDELLQSPELQAVDEVNNRDGPPHGPWSDGLHEQCPNLISAVKWGQGSVWNRTDGSSRKYLPACGVGG